MNQKLSSTSRQVELLEANWDTLIKKANFCCDAWHLHKKTRGGSLVILFICDSMNSQKTNLDTSKKHSILYSPRLTKRSFAMDPGCSPFTYHLPLPRGGGRNQSASPDLPFGGKYSNQLLPLSDRKTVKFRRISRLSSWSLLLSMIGPWFYKLFSSHLFISNWPAISKTTRRSVVRHCPGPAYWVYLQELGRKCHEQIS